MLRRSLFGLLFVLAIGSLVVAEETRGTIVKFDDGSITIRTGGFGFGGRTKGKTETKSEEKTFKVSKDVKISRVAGKDKEDVKLTLDELKTAVKVTNVFVTVTHDGEKGTEIKVGGRVGTGGRRPNKDKQGE
jgi:hypothetical protein